MATAGAAVVIATDWDSISSKWTSIVDVFKSAFTSISSTIQDTFAEIKGNLSTYQNVPSIVVSGKVATIAGVQYNCQVKASAMTQGQKQHNYYVAIRWGGDVYFDATKPIPQGLARMIVAADHAFSLTTNCFLEQYHMSICVKYFHQIIPSKTNCLPFTLIGKKSRILESKSHSAIM